MPFHMQKRMKKDPRDTDPQLVLFDRQEDPVHNFKTWAGMNCALESLQRTDVSVTSVMCEIFVK